MGVIMTLILLQCFNNPKQEYILRGCVLMKSL